jgi:two-component system LytT family sensor kinase
VTTCMIKRLRNQWLKISLKKKLGIYAVMLSLVVGLSVICTIVAMNFVVNSFNTILEDNSRCHDFQEAMELEANAFAGYMRDKSEERRQEYVLACVRTERCLRSLPFNYEEIGSERYARTWNIKNGYENYSLMRENVLEMDSWGEDYITTLYDVYEMQDYLQSYARRLVQVTLKEGNGSYLKKLPNIYNIRYVILIFSAMMLAVIIVLTRVLSNTLVRPLVLLADSSRKIARYDFNVSDLTVDNKDEMGDLVKSFNKMKHATEGYINTLKKNSEIAELLYKEEMEKVEMEKQLEEARLELLKNQINPHFLFNTLNTISGMAKLEEAQTTDQMITSLGSLFRYNLKMSEQIVMLERELKVVEDYMFIQQMRFGGRILYESKLELDPGRVMVPAFTLQPLVENAIIHGLAKKEQGGKVFLRAWQTEEYVVISVADTGLGMEQKRYEEVCRALKENRDRGGKSSGAGIGLGNIYRRIHTMYKKGHIKIYSVQGRGTVIQMWIPKGTGEKEEETHVSGTDS